MIISFNDKASLTFTFMAYIFPVSAFRQPYTSPNPPRPMILGKTYLIFFGNVDDEDKDKDKDDEDYQVGEDNEDGENDSRTTHTKDSEMIFWYTDDDDDYDKDYVGEDENDDGEHDDYWVLVLKLED